MNAPAANRSGAVDRNLNAADLLELFRSVAEGQERIGIEVELPVLDPTSGRSMPYDGSRGMHALLAEALSAGMGIGIVKHDLLVGVELEDGGKLTFEHGGAIEYASPAVASLAEVVQAYRQTLEGLRAVARKLELALVPGGNFPFDSIADANWMPKPYGRFMREHFARLGEVGSHGPTVMAHTTSVQVTLDSDSCDDLIEKVRTATLLTPVAVALFANSPIEEGRITESLSRRMEHWFKTDPARCGAIPAVFRESMSLEDIAEWALDVPMIYFETPGGYASAHGRTFREILARGFPDGRMPTLNDWRSHLSQMWPDVRVRETIELRAGDGPPGPAILAVPALWVGILYDPTIRRAVKALVDIGSPEEYDRAVREAARLGLGACVGGRSMRQLATQVVTLAREGLQRRVDLGQEPAWTVELLAPLEQLVHQGTTFAEACVARFRDTELRPSSFVAAYGL